MLEVLRGTEGGGELTLSEGHFNKNHIQKL